ncbi:MAG: hypothetical protein H8Z69_03750 [Nanohaloarchaea archaeon]|nr:hypothetical protein [Candidatus Nanohaloarchaea archaeon]
MKERLEHALHENGELMVLTDSGEEHELHKHNCEFHDDGFIEIDAAEKVHWLNCEKIERYWIHKEF